jgi:Cys/Met metabolism PLP-dependent enzyme
VRLSVGIEDLADITADLDQALKATRGSAAGPSSQKHDKAQQAAGD